jgi:branched-chain amino acid transport system ATP-binding protein
MAVLEVEHVSTFYGEFQALYAVSLLVEEHALTGIVGANGAGKSTILRTICGLVPARSGSIRHDGVSLEKLSTFEIARRGIALVPEGRRLFPYMTVLDNLLLGAFCKNERESRENRLDSILRFFPILKKRSTQLAGTLSGGEQQMLAIGRALMGKPNIIMLDEPSLGLSPKMISHIYHILDEIRELGITILLVEQNVEWCLRKADRAYIFENGSVVLEGTGKDLLNDDGVRKAYLGL